MPRPRRSERHAVQVSVYLDPETLAEMRQDRLALGALIETMWRERQKQAPLPDDWTDSTPIRPMKLVEKVEKALKPKAGRSHRGKYNQAWDKTICPCGAVEGKPAWDEACPLTPGS